MKRARAFSLAALLALLFLTAPLDAQQVEVTAKDTIRSLAKQYLGNPDLWPAILHANRFDSAAEVTPGEIINIPVAEFKRSEEALKQAEEAIREATEAGARLLATEQINQALQHRDAALAARKKAAWDSVDTYASAARKVAHKATSLSRQRVHAKAEAILEDKRGEVQSRLPQGLVWEGVELQEVLQEREKVRTLSKSMAHILLSDQSRIRMRENSQAVIQKLEVNRLNKEQESKVSLVEGDLHILLGGGSKSDFDLGLEGVETEINSNNFWVNRDRKKTRFANFEGEIAIAIRDQKTVLTQNRGAVVDRGRLSKAIRLLERPTSLIPQNTAVLHQTQVDLHWQQVKGAKEYLVELSDASDFATTLISERKIKTPHFKLPQLRDGVYFWRVAAVDGHGLLGKKSLSYWFKLDAAQYRPFLAVTLPKPLFYTNQPTLEVVGETEPGVPVTINEQSIPVGADGSFAVPLPLDKGENQLSIKASRPGGEATLLTRQVIYLPDDQVLLTADKETPFAAGYRYGALEQVAMRGQTTAGGWISVRQEEQEVAATLADSQGHFSLLAPLSLQQSPLVATVRAPTGRTLSLDLQTQPSPQPVLNLQPLPRQTAKESLVLRGTVEEAIRVTISGEEIPLQQGSFTYRLSLQEGVNRARIIAYGRYGESSVAEPRVVRDSTPPQFVSVAFDPPRSRGGETIQIHLVAKDRSGLTKSLPVAIKVGNLQITGLLVATGQQSYSGRISVPPSGHGKITLEQATLTDRHGNTYAYNF